MPFTFAHPAAVLPMARFFGRHSVLSALVIGSISPDLAYMIPAPIARDESHSVSGLFLFCIPVGLVTYIVFHRLLKGPLLALAPPFLFGKLGQFVEGFASLPSTNWLSILICMMVGAITHLLWDSFTHSGASAVIMFPFLQATVFHIGNYPIHTYKLLQHGSTILGFIVIAWFVLSWLRNAPTKHYVLPIVLSDFQKITSALAIILVPIVAGLLVGVSRIGESDFLFEFQMFAGHAVFAALPTFTFMIVLYSLWWHFRRFRGKSS